MSHVRVGDWIQTFSGKPFWPFDPRPDEIDLEDIAHALSNLCRFSGHVRTFYSVAEHSVWVSSLVDPEYAKWGLLHDATEAYLVDLPRPLKRHGLMGRLYRETEDRLMEVIAARFDLPWPMPAEVKKADSVMLATERKWLMAPCPLPWNEDEAVEPLRWATRYQNVGPFQAREWFLDRARLLGVR